MNTKFSLILLLVGIFTSAYITKVYSLGADTAHPYIVKEARKVWPGDPSDPNAPGPKDAVNEFDQYLDPEKPQKGIAQGSRDEDDPRIWEIFSKPYPHIPALWHYYNLQPPCSAVNLVGGTKSAVDWALELFNEAVKKYNAGEIEPAYYFLGRVAHLLGDMSTPAHVHGDVHSMEDFDYGSDPYKLSVLCPDAYTHQAKDKDLFELYMDEDASRKTEYTDTAKNIFPTFPTFSSPKDILENMANETKKYPSNDYDGSIYKSNQFRWKWRLHYERYAPPGQTAYPVPPIEVEVSSTNGMLQKFYYPTEPLSNKLVFEMSDGGEIEFIISPYDAEFKVVITKIDGNPITPISQTTSWSQIRPPSGTRQIDQLLLISSFPLLQQACLSIYLDSIPATHEEISLPSSEWKTRDTCEKIATNLMPQAIASTASLYKLF